MTGSDRKRLARGAAALGLLVSALIPIALAQAHGSETLQVNREVNTGPLHSQAGDERGDDPVQEAPALHRELAQATGPRPRGGR